MAAKKKTNFKRWLPVFLMGLPGFIYLFINNYMPLYGLIIAFKKYDYSKGIFGSAWAGLSNFKYLFATRDAFVITRNTILYNLGFIILDTVFGVAIAIFLNEVRKKTTKKIYQTFLLLPYLMSMVVVSYLAYAFLGDRTGIINGFIQSIGGKPISFYMEQKYWPFILLFVYEWRMIGYGSIIYLATLVGIDGSFYEAAELDGATKWQQIKYVTLPSLVPMITVMLLLSVGSVMRSDTGLFYQVTRDSGILYNTTQVIDSYVLHAITKNSSFGFTAATTFFQSVVGLLLMLFANWMVKRISPEDALF